MPVARSEFATTDIEAVRALLSAAYAEGLSIEQAPDRSFAFEQASGSDGTITVSTLRFDGRVSAQMEGSRDVLFTDISEGSYAWESRGRRGDQDRSLILPAEHDLAADFTSVRSVMVNIDAATVARWLSRYGGLPPSPALLHQAAAGSDGVRHALRFFAEVMPTDSFESDLVRANLLDVLLSMTAHHLLPDAAPAQRGEAPAALRRAEEFLREHAGEAVSLADAAAEARLSIRGLEGQFRRWRHTTPAAYLRSVRLESARRDLVAAHRDGVPVRVSDIARRWGFAHLGRFSSYYAEAFGELPSATLRDD
jgi:AraC-like DNA-binding protein